MVRIARLGEIFGGVLPEEVAGVHIAKCDTGVVELSGLACACRIIGCHPGMLERVKGRMLDVHMDNFEDVRLLQAGRVRGECTVEKQQLLLGFQHYMWKWNTCERMCYVNTLDNPADDPSRQGFKGETCLSRVRCGRFREGSTSMPWRHVRIDSPTRPEARCPSSA